jgi:Family of unknown function (DUF6459)
MSADPHPPRPLPPVQGTLALDLPLPGFPTPISEPSAQPGLRVVADAGANDAPSAEAWALTFVRAVLEVVSGDRPIHQMIRWTDEGVYADLQHRVTALSRTGHRYPDPSASGSGRPRVHTVHVSQPAPDIAEVAAHVRHGRRSRAIALRLESGRGRWLCTALEFG